MRKLNWLAHPAASLVLLVVTACFHVAAEDGIPENWFRIVLTGAVLVAVSLIRVGAMGGFMFRAGALLATIGFLVGARFAIQASFVVREGEMTRFLRLERGEAPGEWSPFKEGDTAPEARNYWDPGFGIAYFRLPDGVRTVPVDSPAAQGYSLEAAGFEDSGEYTAELAMTDSESGREILLPSMRKGELRSFEGGQVRLDYVENRGAKKGYALKLMYEPSERNPEEFWILAAYPGFDQASRRGSRHFFRVNSVRPVLQLRGRVSSAPGRMLWVAGLGVMLLGALAWGIPMARPFARRISRWKAA